MPGGRDSEIILVPGSILESAMLAWLGSDVTGPSTVDMSTHTLTGYSWGAISQVFLAHLGLGLLFSMESAL